jgi:hypothetical protein
MRERCSSHSALLRSESGTVSNSVVPSPPLVDGAVLLRWRSRGTAVLRWGRAAPDVRQITTTHFLSLSGRPVKHENDGLQHHMLRSRINFPSALDLSGADTPAVLLQACNTYHIARVLKWLRYQSIYDGLTLARAQLFRKPLARVGCTKICLGARRLGSGASSCPSIRSRGARRPARGRHAGTPVPQQPELVPS